MRPVHQCSAPWSQIRVRLTLLGMCLALGSAGAEVIYVDIDDFTLGPRGPGIDLDGDGTTDFIFGMGMDCPAGCTAGIQAQAGGIVGSDDWSAAGLSAGAPIGPQLTYFEHAILATYGAGGCYAGDWCVQGAELYIGVRFTSADVEHYGWIRTRTTPGILVLDYAYETDADMPIVAGAGLPCRDLDADREVGLSDLSILLSHFGMPAGASFGEGDLDSDADVDLDDLVRLLADFGFVCP